MKNTDFKIPINYRDYQTAKKGLERLKRKKLILGWLAYLLLDTVEGDWYIWVNNVDGIQDLVKEHITKWRVMETKYLNT